jgi:thiol-disulfide isomerase/thioredoxin
MKQLISFIIVAVLSGCFGAPPEKNNLEGKSLPAFSLILADSTIIKTESIPTGKPLVFFFFSPYCPHCRAQTKEITEDMDRLKGIQFYFVSSFSMPDLLAYYKEYDLKKYPNIVMGVDSGNIGADYFEIAGVPYTAIYGKDKKFNKSFMGKVYSSQLKRVAEE